MRLLALLTWLLLSLPLAARAETLPKRIVDLRFKDLSGVAGKISDFKKKKALVLVFREATCPISEKFGPLVAELEKQYSARDVAFLFVYVGKVKPREHALSDRKKNGFKGTYVLDDEFDFVTALVGQTTTEVFVLGPSRKILYRGAVNDQYNLGATLPVAQNQFLTTALDSVLARREIAVPLTTAPGCILNQKAPPKYASQSTYFRDIRPILQKRCVICHFSEGSAPFGLETYDDVAGRKNMIEYVVRKGLMPPWYVDESTGPFLNDMRLPDSEKAVLSEWLLGGVPEGVAPAGTPAKIPVAKWKLGPPDVIFPLPKKMKVQKDGFMPYQYLRFPTNFKEERWVKSAEIITHPKVVHHIVFNVLENMNFAGDTWGLPGFSWTIGEQPEVLPEGSGVKIPAGGAIGVTVHYQPNGTETEDTTTSIGLRFYDKKPLTEVKYRVLDHNRDFTIPPGKADFELQDKFKADEDMVITGVSPHMHMRGQRASLRVTYPNGSKKEIFKLNRYNFDFQLVYTFKEPVKVPKGSVVDCRLWFDNSENNPNNPDPKQAVHWGDQVSDEMFLCNVQWHSAILERPTP